MSQVQLSLRGKLYIAGGLVVATVLFLYLVHDILTPFILAGATAYILNPVVSWVSQRGRVRRVWVVLLVYAASGLMLVWVSVSLFPVIFNQVSELRKELPGLILGIQDYFKANDSIEIGGITVDLEMANRQLSQALSELANRVSQSAIPVLFGVVESLIKVLVYLLATFYLLLDGERFIQGIVRLAPARHRDEMRVVLRKVNNTLGSYLRGQLVLFVIMSVATYTLLTVLQVRYALFLAVATGALELIPFVGPYLAGAMAVTIALTQPTAPFGWSHILLAAVIAVGYLVLRMVEDHFVIPNVIGRFVDLHPLVVIFVVLSGATIGGLLGLLLAVPVAATIKVVAAHILSKYWLEEPEAGPVDQKAEAAASRPVEHRERVAPATD